MFQPLSKDGTDMGITDGVKDIFPFLAELHQAAVSEDPKLMGNGGIGHLQALGQIPDAHLVPLKSRQDAHPGEISENTEGFSQVI